MFCSLTVYVAIESSTVFADAYSSKHLRYKWQKNPGLKIADSKMSQFELVAHRTYYEEEIYVAGMHFVFMLVPFSHLTDIHI